MEKLIVWKDCEDVDLTLKIRSKSLSANSIFVAEVYYCIGHKYSHPDASIDRQKHRVYRQPCRPCKISLSLLTESILNASIKEASVEFSIFPCCIFT